MIVALRALEPNAEKPARGAGRQVLRLVLVGLEKERAGRGLQTDPLFRLHGDDFEVVWSFYTELAGAVAALVKTLPNDALGSYKDAVAAAADEYRDAIGKRWGKTALVSVAFAITAARIYPTVKYAFGHGKACMRVVVGGTPVALDHGRAPASHDAIVRTA